MNPDTALIAPWTKESIWKVLTKTIGEMQVLGGNPLPVFTDDLVPLGGLIHFDSLVAVDVLTSLSELFDLEMPSDLFYDSKTYQPLPLSKVFAKLCAVMGLPLNNLESHNINI